MYRHRLSSNPSFAYEGYYNSFTYYQEIRDSKNPKIHGKYRDGDCSNVKVVGRLISDLPSYQDGGLTVFADKYPPYCFPVDVLSVVPSVSDGSWDNFFYDAFNEFATQIPEEVSSYNFLWEGKEIAELLPKLEKSLSQTVKGGYLNWNFGWKPFLQDLNNFSNIVSIVQNRINHLIEINGKVTRLSSYKKDVQSIPYIRDWVSPAGGVWEFRLKSYCANLRASGRLFSDLQGLKDEANFWRAAAVALGLTNPLKAFWESIPFSFVLDWFNRIGARIFNLSVNPFRGSWDISRLCTSCDETASVGFRWNYGGHIVPIGNFAVTRYTRYSGFPAQPSIFTIDALSPKQQTLLLAMI
jgi:hypothetical protein